MSQDNAGCAPGITLKNLTLKFGAQRVFSGLRLSLPAGKLTALLGTSGCGKTSLLRIIAGILTPSAGQIETSDGQPLVGRIAWMGQRDLLYPWLTALDNVALGARLRGETPDIHRARDLLAQVGLADSHKLLPAALSGGMRQRVALARTLYERAPVVLMDEPFSALDALTRTAIQTLACKLLSKRTVLLITHDPLEACRLAHQLVVMGRFPAALDTRYQMGGNPPRAPDNPDVLRGQGELLKQLLRAEQ